MSKKALVQEEMFQKEKKPSQSLLQTAKNHDHYFFPLGVGQDTSTTVTPQVSYKSPGSFFNAKPSFFF